MCLQLRYLSLGPHDYLKTPNSIIFELIVTIDARHTIFGGKSLLFPVQINFFHNLMPIKMTKSPYDQMTRWQYFRCVCVGGGGSR